MDTAAQIEKLRIIASVMFSAGCMSAVAAVALYFRFGFFRHAAGNRRAGRAGKGKPEAVRVKKKKAARATGDSPEPIRVVGTPGGTGVLAGPPSAPKAEMPPDEFPAVPGTGGIDVRNKIILPEGGDARCATYGSE